MRTNPKVPLTWNSDVSTHYLRYYVSYKLKEFDTFLLGLACGNWTLHHKDPQHREAGGWARVPPRTIMWSGPRYFCGQMLSLNVPVLARYIDHYAVNRFISKPDNDLGDPF